MILSDDGVLADPLLCHLDLMGTFSQHPDTKKEMERTLILRALEEHDWTVGGSEGAAARLGMKRTTLIAKMQRFGISRPVTGPGSGLREDSNSLPHL